VRTSGFFDGGGGAGFGGCAASGVVLNENGLSSDWGGGTAGCDGGPAGADGPGAGAAGVSEEVGARSFCLQCGQRTCFPNSSIPTPILRPQKGHGKVSVCDAIGYSVQNKRAGGEVLLAPVGPHERFAEGCILPGLNATSTSKPS